MPRPPLFLLALLFLANGALQLGRGSYGLGLVMLVMSPVFLIIALRRRSVGASPATDASPGFAQQPWFRLALWALFAAFLIGGVGWVFAPSEAAGRLPLAVVVASFVGLLGLTGASAIRRVLHARR